MSALTWAVAAVVSDDAGRVLLCRQGRGERRWALPGGRLRREESPAAAVLRNIRTETGWDVQIVDLVGLYRLSDRGTAPPPAGRCGPLPDVLVHVFRARVTAGTPTADPTGGCHLGWHAPATCRTPSPRSPGPPSSTRWPAGPGCCGTPGGSRRGRPLPRPSGSPAEGPAQPPAQGPAQGPA
ncbi:NUDIX hydrolase, partial [Micromonospora sp. ATA51]|uniref:NUDIX hydrolase n=1 Tax=Micromonospora sp. ATA51 TaxID=2806098 RepID=UPI001A60EF5E